MTAFWHPGTMNSTNLITVWLLTIQGYIFKKKIDGVNIINLKKTWEKLMLAARAVAAIENPEDVYVVSSRAYGQRACLKFARYIGATAIAGRFTPGLWKPTGFDMWPWCIILCRYIHALIDNFLFNIFRCIHKSDPSRLPWTPLVSGNRSPCRSPTCNGELLCQHPNHCFL